VSEYYLLEDRKAVPTDVRTWARFFESGDRIVAKSQLGDVRVSTVFLGLDHRFDDEGPPLIFETMIFGGHHADYQTRCSTWEEAEEMHRVACVLAERGAEP
jgi:hypothetical protein